MKLLLVFLNNDYRTFVPINLTSIEGYLKSFGHEVEVFDTSFYSEVVNLDDYKARVKSGAYRGVDYDVELKEQSPTDDFLTHIEDFQPDLIGFGVYSYTLGLADRLAKAAKSKFPKTPIIYGGTHPTTQPDTTITKEWVDFICMGEGEEPLRDLLDAMQSGQSPPQSRLNNIWTQEADGTIAKSPMRPPMDVNNLPLHDWDSYAKYHHMGAIEGKVYRLAHVEFTRGCPFVCSFCEGTDVQALYKDAGHKKHYVRHKTPKKFVDECAYLVDKYDVEFFYLVDGTFLCFSDSILEELVKLYKERVGRPFLAMTTINSVTERRADLLAEMGCYQINLAIEVGNKKYRDEILHKPRFTNDKAVETFRFLRERGIRTSSYNMIGLPWQNREDVFDTIQLNRDCKPTRTNVTIYTPFGRTALNQMMLNEGYIDDLTELGSHSTCTVKVPTDMSSQEITNLYQLFHLYCKAPKKLFPVIQQCESDLEKHQPIVDGLKELYV